MHIAHHLTGSAPTCLNLINKKEHIVLITKFPKSLHKFHRCRMDTALALYRFYHDGYGVLCAGILESFKVIIGGIGKSVGHRSEAYLASVSRLSGCGHGTKGSSVEAHFCSYNMVTVGTVFFDSVFSGHFDHGLICLCTGILEKDLVHSDGSADFFRKKCLWNGIRIIEGMHQCLCLVYNRFYYLLIAASCGVYCDTCIKIQIFFALLIVDILVFCTFCQKIHSLIGLDHVFIYFFLDILKCQSCFFQLHFFSSPFVICSDKICSRVIRPFITRYSSIIFTHPAIPTFSLFSVIS